MNCEMCGKESSLKTVKIEGINMQVCGQCAKYGQEVQKVKFVERRKFEKVEIEKEVVENYANIIKLAREKLGLKQEELAKKLNEKESTISHIESGKYPPNIRLAEKLEKFFNIDLIEEIEDEVEVTSGSESGELTIGDMIKIKK